MSDDHHTADRQPTPAPGRDASPDGPTEDSLFPLYCRNCHRPVPRDFSDTHGGLCLPCFQAEQQRAAQEVAALQAAAEAERQRRALPPPPEPEDDEDDEFEDALLGLTP